MVIEIGNGSDISVNFDMQLLASLQHHELLIIRRFFKAPRLILTVATIAVSQILALVGLLLPRVFDLD